VSNTVICNNNNNNNKGYSTLGPV